MRAGTNGEKMICSIIWNVIRKSRRAFRFLIKMQCGYKRLENDVKHHLKQNEKRNEKRGSISYAARTAQHNNRPVSVSGVSFRRAERTVPFGCVSAVVVMWCTRSRLYRSSDNPQNFQYNQENILLRYRILLRIWDFDISINRISSEGCRLGSRVTSRPSSVIRRMFYMV